MYFFEYDDDCHVVMEGNSPLHALCNLYAYNGGTYGVSDSTFAKIVKDLSLVEAVNVYNALKTDETIRSMHQLGEKLYG